MQLPNRIHIFGASGSGTTSLATALAAKHSHRHFDIDDFYWFPTDPPYQRKHPPEVRLALLRSALTDSVSWVISGSLCGWGDPLIPEFELVVFLLVPSQVRLARLRAREIERYGREASAACTCPACQQPLPTLSFILPKASSLCAGSSYVVSLPLEVSNAEPGYRPFARMTNSSEKLSISIQGPGSGVTEN